MYVSGLEQFYISFVAQATKDISDIFSAQISDDENTEYTKPNIILIEGAPGIGKTILSKEIAFQWANKNILQEKSLLFLISLRDPYIQQVKSLEQFVCYVTNSYQKNSTVEAVMEYLESTSGEHCVIVFDGYGEISESIRKDSLIGKIMSHKILKLCGLVITSRPIASASLHDMVDCRVEILGFTKEDRKEYIHRSLKGNVEEIQKMEHYLETNAFIDSLCYIPLNMTILICLFKESLESDNALPKTQTEINKLFIMITISRYLWKEKNVSLKGHTLECLPSSYKQQLHVLAKLAYVFLGEEKLVFNDCDIATDCPKYVGKFNTLGLLKVVEYRNFREGSSHVSYNYLHFSIQEFLAAYYIATSSDKKQIQILKENFWDPRFLNTSIMYAGLTCGKSFALKHFLIVWT